jgi:hypothetical protein
MVIFYIVLGIVTIGITLSCLDIVEDVTTSKILWFAPWMILGILMGLVCLCVIPEIMMLWFVYGFSLLVIDEKFRNDEYKRSRRALL